MHKIILALQNSFIYVVYFYIFVDSGVKF